MDNPLLDSMVRAIVHLNFNEPDQALSVLLVALANSNFEKEISVYGNRTQRIA